MTIKPFCIPSVEIEGRKKEDLALIESRPGYDGNVNQDPIPDTGEVPFFSPADDENPIGEEFNTGGTVPEEPTVIATDGTQVIT